MALINYDQYLPQYKPTDIMTPIAEGMKMGDAMRQRQAQTKLSQLYGSPEFQSMSPDQQIKAALPIYAENDPAGALKVTAQMKADADATEDNELKMWGGVLESANDTKSKNEILRMMKDRFSSSPRYGGMLSMYDKVIAIGNNKTGITRPMKTEQILSSFPNAPKNLIPGAVYSVPISTAGELLPEEIKDYKVSDLYTDAEITIGGVTTKKRIPKDPSAKAILASLELPEEEDIGTKESNTTLDDYYTKAGTSSKIKFDTNGRILSVDGKPVKAGTTLASLGLSKKAPGKSPEEIFAAAIARQDAKKGDFLGLKNNFLGRESTKNPIEKLQDLSSAITLGNEAKTNTAAAGAFSATVSRLFEKGVLTNQDVDRYAGGQSWSEKLNRWVEKGSKGTMPKTDVAGLLGIVNAVSNANKSNLQKEYSAELDSAAADGVDRITYKNVLNPHISPYLKNTNTNKLDKKDQDAIDWLKNNPNHPSANKVREKLKSKGLWK